MDHRSEIDGISGWGLVGPLMDKLPESVAQACQKCESPIEQLFAASLGVVIHTIEEDERPTIQTQVPIGRYRADIVVTGRNGAPRIVVECDGSAFHTDKAKDAKRTEEIERQGYRVLRRTGSQIHHNPLAEAKHILVETGLIPMTYMDAKRMVEACPL